LCLLNVVVVSVSWHFIAIERPMLQRNPVCIASFMSQCNMRSPPLDSVQVIELALIDICFLFLLLIYHNKKLRFRCCCYCCNTRHNIDRVATRLCTAWQSRCVSRRHTGRRAPQTSEKCQEKSMSVLLLLLFGVVWLLLSCCCRCARLRLQRMRCVCWTMTRMIVMHQTTRIIS
jgi:hypothetical protein